VYGPQMGTEHVIPQFVLRLKHLTQGPGRVILPIQGTGRETRSFLFIDDFIDAFLTIMDRGDHQEIYHVGTEEEVTVATLAQMVGRYFGREVQIMPGELPEGSPMRRCPSTAKIRRLGFAPKISLAEGIHLTADWYTEVSTKVA